MPPPGPAISPAPAVAPVAAVTEPVVIAPARQPLEHKVVLGTLAMVVLPTLLCALGFHALVHRALTQHHARHVALVAQTTATALAPALGEGWSPQAAQVVQPLRMDHRLTFVLVLDADHRPLHRHVSHRDAWAAYDASLVRSPPAARVQVEHPLVLSRDGATVAWKAPIWSAGGELRGFVVLAMRDANLPHTMAQLRLAPLAVAALVCLMSLPLVRWAARRWTARLSALVEATRRLAAGEPPPPLPAAGGDEISALAAAFNHMADQLVVATRDLRAANEQLEHKVRRRTEQLQRLNDQLQAEVHDKNEFLRAVSHDLSAPLRNIGGMTTMLLMKYRDALTRDAVSKLERIHANVKAQSDLINDLLELSRLRNRPAKREAVDLGAVLRQIRDSLAFELERDGIELLLPDDLPPIHAHRNRIRQVFQNLIDNAVKYMLDARERRIVVDHWEEGDHLVFSVSDTGRGIAGEDLPELFQPFRRSTHSGSHQVAGRGLGLATVKTILEGYRGRIWADSVLGRGSTFYFTLQKDCVQPSPDEAALAECALPSGQG